MIDCTDNWENCNLERIYKNNKFENINKFCGNFNCFTLANLNIPRGTLEIIGNKDQLKQKLFNKIYGDNLIDDSTDDKQTYIYSYKIYSIISVINDYMRENFEIISTSDDIKFKESSEIEKDVIIIFKNFYKTIIKDKTTNDLFDVYYTNYDLKFKKDSTDIILNYYAINIILPNIAKINQFGIYDKITYAGILNWKPFEYEVKISKGKDLKIKQYKFIGNYLQYLWPLPEPNIKLEDKIKSIKEKIKPV
jgi:hypothetical protein